MATAATAAPDRVSLFVQAEALAEPVTIHAFTGGWRDALRPGDEASLHARAELRADDGPWHVAWRWRYDYELRFDPETAELYHHIRNRTPVEAGRAYPLDLTAYHVERHGPAFGYQYQEGPLTVEASLNLYQGLTVIAGQTRGQAVFASPQATGDQLQDFFVQIDYRYSSPELQEEDLGWNPPKPDSWGYGIDLALEGRLPGGTRASLRAQDLAGALFWQDLPQTRLAATCDCTIPRYDVAGGLRQEASRRQRLHNWLDAELAHPLGPLLEANVRQLRDPLGGTTQWGFRYRANPRQNMGLWYEPRWRAWRLAWEGEHTVLSWTADSLDTSRAYRMGLTAGLMRRW